MSKKESKLISKPEIRVQFRCDEKMVHMLQFLADRYAGGSKSKWIRHAILEAPRQKLK